MAEFIAMACFFAAAAGVFASFFIFTFMACGIIKPDTVGIIITVMMFLSSVSLLIEFF